MHLEIQRDVEGIPIPLRGIPADAKYNARTAAALILYQNPGKWYLIGTVAQANQATSVAYAIRHGQSGWTQFGYGYLAEAVTMHEEHRIYACYKLAEDA